MSQTGSTSRTVGSLGSSTDSTVGSVNNQKGEFGNKHRKIIRILTVVAYIMSVSTAALLLSAYYVFLWDPKEPDFNSLSSRRPTDSPSTMAHHGYTNYPSFPANNNMNGGGYGKVYNSRHISSALNAPYPSDATMRTTRSSKKGYSNHYTKPTVPQIPTPQSLIMEKMILTSTTPSHRTEPLSLGVGGAPDDPKGTKSIWVTTPKTLGF